MPPAEASASSATSARERMSSPPARVDARVDGGQGGGGGCSHSALVLLVVIRTTLERRPAKEDGRVAPAVFGVAQVRWLRTRNAGLAAPTSATPTGTDCASPRRRHWCPARRVAPPCPGCSCSPRPR